MRLSYVLGFFLALSLPAAAAAADADQNLKQEIGKAVSAYAATFETLNPAGWRRDGDSNP